MVIDKDNIKIILILLILGLGIGYAYINSDLSINGTAQVNSANWDVHWANIQVASGSVSASSPTISNQTTVNYSVILDQPGDYYEFTVDAVNGGSIDAMIDTIDSKLNGATITTLPDYLSYEVTYSDGVELEQNHELLANTTETYKVKVKYRDDIELSQIPASDQTLSLSFTVTYRQATTDSEPVNHGTTVYTVSSTSSYIGQAMPNDITQYNSASDAMAAFENRPFYLKHTVQGGIVTESYVEFVVTTAMASSNTGMTAGTYALRGAGATYNAQEAYYENDSPYYESNKATLLSAFGSSYCTDYSSHFYCSVSGLYAYANSRGHVYANDGGAHGNVRARVGGWGCDVGSDGSSGCDA